jgi:predicted ester cyclase
MLRNCASARHISWLTVPWRTSRPSSTPTPVTARTSTSRPRVAAADPSAFYATALWLRNAYAELRWDIHDIVADGDLVVLHATMSGGHTGTFVDYDAAARPAQAFPPTGTRFATTQTHWFRIADGKVIEHWANRDDLGTAMQLGWTPPSPLYMIRMVLATRRARRET